MKQYEVTGMSCAACSARVEKAVSKVPGVTSCSVSLLTNSMGVEGTATDQEIVNAVVAAGYGAEVFFLYFLHPQWLPVIQPQYFHIHRSYYFFSYNFNFNCSIKLLIPLRSACDRFSFSFLEYTVIK